MSTMTKENAIGILQSRTPISSPGRYVVKVTNCGDFHRELPQGGSVVAIANFNAMTPYQMGQAKEDLTKGDFPAALNHNLSFSIRNTDFRPAKGERVNIDVDYITTKEGAQALMVVGLSAIQAVSVSAKCDFSAFLDDAETVETAEEVAATASGDLD